MNNRISIGRIFILLFCVLIVVYFIWLNLSPPFHSLSTFQPNSRQNYIDWSHNNNIARGYSLNKILREKNGDLLFNETTSGTLESLYLNLNIYIHDKKATLDALGNPIYFLGSNNPPKAFEERWGHFVLYSWGRDGKRDTYFDKWKQIPCWDIDPGNEDGDYIIYSDKVDFKRMDNRMKPLEYMLDGTTDLILIPQKGQELKNEHIWGI